MTYGLKASSCDPLKVEKCIWLNIDKEWKDSFIQKYASKCIIKAEVG